MDATAQAKPPMFVNNTGCDLGAFWPAVRASLTATGAMPEELADLFTAEVVEVDGQKRFIVESR